ncbi:MAG TPA: serine/threonine-protein kinase [Acidimicrobiales bacterium]|nr:serine/threonine-protein kinase [Acidimicrobiales bacterium]
MRATGELLKGRYRLGPLVGRGGMADVYRADDTVTGEEVAIKMLRRLPDGASWSTREIRALERLDHPSLVRLRDCDLDDGVPYLVLDLVDGQSLADVLARGPLVTARAVALAAEIAGGLAHAHERGVAHGDVKPGNILLDEAGRAHLADFGVARLVDATATTGAGFVVGTAAYLAPEQVRAERCGPPADVYALGLVLLECLTGRRAFPGTFNEAAVAHLTRDPDIPPSVPAGLATIIAAATARDAMRRPSAAALARSLTRPAASESPPTVPVTRQEPATARMGAPPPAALPRTRSGRGLTAAAIAVGGAVGLAGALLIVERGSSGQTPPTTVVTTAPATTVPPTTAPPTTVAPRATTTVPATTTTPPTTTGHGNGRGKKKGNGD